MKNIMLILLICASLYNVDAQSNKRELFEKYTENFDIFQYPYIASTDFERMTRVDKAHGGGIDSIPLKMFVYDQGIKPFAWVCNLSDFYGFNAYIQFPPTDSVFKLILLLDTEPSCGSGELLATYSKSDFHLIDTLAISSRGSVMPQFINNKKIFQSALIESTLSSDTIQVYRKESFSMEQPNNKQKRIKIVIFRSKYIMTNGGKFIKVKEEKEEEILDEIGKKIEFPKVPFLGRR